MCNVKKSNKAGTSRGVSRAAEPPPILWKKFQPPMAKKNLRFLSRHRWQPGLVVRVLLSWFSIETFSIIVFSLTMPKLLKENF
jgi:hypothetical protein